MSNKPVNTAKEVVQYEHLNKEAQEAVIFLSEKMTANDLLQLNPLVQSMVQVESFLDLKYTDLQDKETIQKFKDHKKVIGSFNAAVRKTKKELKAPYWEIGKKLDLIEKSFLNRAKEVKELMESEFQPYLDDEQRKKDQRETKKNAEREAEMKRVQNDLSASVENAAKQQIYTRLKYEIVGAWYSDSMNQLNKLNKDHVERFFNTITVNPYEFLKHSFILRPDVSLEKWNSLDEAQKNDIIEFFEEKLYALREAYKNRYDDLVKLESNMPAYDPVQPDTKIIDFSQVTCNELLDDLIALQAKAEGYEHHTENMEEKQIAYDVSVMMKNAIKYIRPKIVAL